MLFNSIEYLIFLFSIGVIYFILPKNYQKYFLILSSVFFYAYYIFWHLFLLLAIVAVNYYYGLITEKQESPKRIFLIIIILINVSVLFLFKYFNFFNLNLLKLAGFLGWNYPVSYLQILLPLGISFYMFKCISYNIEVHRKNIRAVKRFDTFTLYIIIFPELVAGPIDKPQNLIPQLEIHHKYEYTRVTNGLKLIAWGLFQKWVIADRLAEIVNQVYNTPRSYDGLAFFIATVFFAIQIYCDFSAYSDIAIGTGEVLGFRLMKNFNRPYFAKSVPEFWRRWHISLSTWFRDYLFLPIAYKIFRVLKNKPFLKIKADYWSYSISTIITMLTAGLWHGANWTFILWGLILGIFLVFSIITKTIRNKLLKICKIKKFSSFHKLISVCLTFLLINFSWIFFRANSLNDALYIISHLFSGIFLYLKGAFINIIHLKIFDAVNPLFLSGNRLDMYLNLLFIIILFTVQLIQRKHEITVLIANKPLIVRWALYLMLILVILVFGKFESRQFIYMQF